MEQYWNWQASTFTALTPTYTDLNTSPPSGGVTAYTTDYFQNNAAWEADHSYTAQFFATDKAGNLGTASEVDFTFDISSPSTRILQPFDANKKGVSSLAAITGTASDNNNGRNSAVSIAVRKDAGTSVWYKHAGRSRLQRGRRGPGVDKRVAWRTAASCPLTPRAGCSRRQALITL